MQASGHHDQHFHARQRLFPRQFRPENHADVQRQSLLHHALQPRPVSPNGLHVPQNPNDPLNLERDGLTPLALHTPYQPKTPTSPTAGGVEIPLYNPADHAPLKHFVFSSACRHSFWPLFSNHLGSTATSTQRTPALPKTRRHHPRNRQKFGRRPWRLRSRPRYEQLAGTQ